MVRPIEQGGIDARVRAQQADIYLREKFLQLTKPTQQAIVDLLGAMQKFLERDKPRVAQRYFFQQASRHMQHTDRFGTDESGIDWHEVKQQILYSCFSDSDMEGYTIVPRRIASQLTVFQSLMELPYEREDF